MSVGRCFSRSYSNTGKKPGVIHIPCSDPLVTVPFLVRLLTPPDILGEGFFLFKISVKPEFRIVHDKHGPHTDAHSFVDLQPGS